MLRSVELKLDALDRSGSCRHQGNKLDKQEAIWSYWATLFCQSREHQSLMFPELEDLRLDFSDWGLDRSDRSKLRVRTFFQCQRYSSSRAKFILGRAIFKKATPVRWIEKPLDRQCEA